MLLLSGCATTEQALIADQSVDGTMESKIDADKTQQSASACEGGAANSISWQCRILDGKSYVIAVQENQQSANTASSPDSARASNTGQTYQYVDSTVTDFRQLDDDFYAVQIFANSNKETAIAFINTKRLGRARLLSTQVNGRDWYVALLGVYADRDLAKKRAKAYQEVHRGVAPWIRTVKSLKAVYKQTIF
jgi:septal ring-binding cell division protein DamX